MLTEYLIILLSFGQNFYIFLKTEGFFVKIDEPHGKMSHSYIVCRGKEVYNEETDGYSFHARLYHILKKGANMMKSTGRIIISLTAAAMSAALVVFSPFSAAVASANEEVLERGDEFQNYPLFDVSDRVVKIRAGESKAIELFARFDYTYYTSGHTSSKTYCECNWKKGNSKPILHIGADEQAKNITFYFYINDEKGLKDTEYNGQQELYAEVEVYVQPAASANAQTAATAAAATAKSVAVSMKKGAAGTLSLTADDTIAMLYDSKGTALASFSVSDGTGNMPKLSLGAVSSQNGKNYFTVVTKKMNETAVKISDSDKAVMTKCGFAGVCLNGNFVNWP